MAAEKSSDVRSWASERGLKVSPRGPISGEVRAAFRTAHATTPLDADKHQPAKAAPAANKAAAKTSRTWKPPTGVGASQTPLTMNLAASRSPAPPPKPQPAAQQLRRNWRCTNCVTASRLTSASTRWRQR